MAEIKGTSANFEAEVINSSIPVIVDFWADWCGPCKMLAPILAEVATEKEGAVKVCKVNVDEEQDLAAKYGIMSIPAVFRFDGGEVTKKSVGYVPKAQLLANLGL
ncbi:MAG: thioredoxin [Lachnospiraceae bacterium]|nr:thioredoxin [Lachnospiraceae bacterium]